VVLAHGLHNAPNPSSNSVLGRPGLWLDMLLYLCDAERSPFLLPQQLQSASRAVEVILGDHLEHLLGKLHVTVLVNVVRVPMQLSAGTRRATSRLKSYLAE
jgi:hypothetical protein